VKCRVVRRKLVAYLDGEVDEKQKMLIEGHLNQCDGCRKEINLLTKTSQFLKSWKRIEASEDLEANFWKKVSLEKERYFLPQPILRWLTPIALPVSIAAVLIVGVILGNFVGEFTSSQSANLWEEEYVSLSGLDSFQDFLPDSVSEVYFNLTEIEGGK